MSNTFYLKPGEYFIGDPCLILDNDSKEQQDLWITLLEKCNFFRDNHVGLFNGFYPIFAGQTKYGNGSYFIKELHFFITSGLLGIVSWENVLGINPLVNREELLHQGEIIEFKDDFIITFSETDPTHIFGDIKIYSEETDWLLEEEDLRRHCHLEELDYDEDYNEYTTRHYHGA